MTVLHTARLRLEPLSDAHFTGLQAMNDDPEVMRYLGGRTEAARCILQYAFDTLHAPKACAIRHPDNLRSQRTMERLGMRHVGRHGAHADAPALHELTRADWLARHIESRP